MAPSARRVSRVASRLPGTTRLRFALHGGQRWRAANEIPALRELLDPLSIKGRVITADALHTQRETARFLVEEKGAHYLFTVKDNQKTLANDLKAFDWESIPP